MSGVDPETYLFGANKAAGGYGEDFHSSDPDAHPTILVGVDPRYRAALMRQGFKWAENRAAAEAGLIDDSVAEALQQTQLVPATCVQGVAAQFPCLNVDFQAQIALNQFSTQPLSAANLWGLVDLNDMHEYAVIGLRNGTAVIDVTNPSSPREVGTVPGNASPWREVKIYQHFDAAASRYRAYAYVSTEAPNSGIQVIDLSGLPNSVRLATTVPDTGTQHTLYVSNIDYATNVALPGRQAYLYVAGSNLNAGAWRKYSLAVPSSPQFIVRPPDGTQYMHDSTGLFLTDNRTTECDQGHNPCEVLVDFNVNTVDLWDVTAQPVLLSSTPYVNATYTHSGWPTDDQRFLFIHDELEEIQRSLNTHIYTMDLADLRAPTVVASYSGDTTTTDHNGYTKGDRYYVSHYRRGLVVFDASNPTQLREAGFFDTFLAPTANAAGTDGAWGVYPFLPSGNVVVSDISNGLFVLKDNTAGVAQSAGRLGFVAAGLSGLESVGSATIRVQRSGGFAGPVTVQYATSSGTATANVDYVPSSGTLTWAADELREKSFVIQVLDETLDEPDETITITLSNPTGGATLDGAATIDYTIRNNDSPTPPPSSTGGGGDGGGGGALDFPFLALLAALAGNGLRRRYRPPVSPLRAASRRRASRASRRAGATRRRRTLPRSRNRAGCAACRAASRKRADPSSCARARPARGETSDFRAAARRSRASAACARSRAETRTGTCPRTARAPQLPR